MGRNGPVARRRIRVHCCASLQRIRIRPWSLAFGSLVAVMCICMGNGHAQTSEKTWRTKGFVIPSSALVVATVWDIEATHQGLSWTHKSPGYAPCPEGDPIFSRHPSRGELYWKQSLLTGGTVGVGLLLHKARAPKWIYESLAGGYAAGHSFAAIRWYLQCY